MNMELREMVLTNVIKTQNEIFLAMCKLAAVLFETSCHDLSLLLSLCSHSAFERMETRGIVKSQRDRALFLLKLQAQSCLGMNM